MVKARGTREDSPYTRRDITSPTKPDPSWAPPLKSPEIYLDSVRNPMYKTCSLLLSFTAIHFKNVFKNAHTEQFKCYQAKYVFPKGHSAPENCERGSFWEQQPTGEETGHAHVCHTVNLVCLSELWCCKPIMLDGLYVGYQASANISLSMLQGLPFLLIALFKFH